MRLLTRTGPSPFFPLTGDWWVFVGWVASLRFCERPAGQGGRDFTACRSLQLRQDRQKPSDVQPLAQWYAFLSPSKAGAWVRSVFASQLWPEQSCLLLLPPTCGCAQVWCPRSSWRGRREACHRCAAPGGFWPSAFQFYVLSLLLCECFLYCKVILKTRRKGFCPSPCINLLVISFDAWIRAWVTLPAPARENFGKAAAHSSGAALRVMPRSRSRSTPDPLRI